MGLTVPRERDSEKFLLFFDAIFLVSFQVLFPPLYSPILEPHFDLRFAQVEGRCQVVSSAADHVLLSLKLRFQALQLLWCEDGAHSF